MTRQDIVNELDKHGISARVVFNSKRNEAWLYLDRGSLGRLLREETYEVPEYRELFFSELKGDAELCYA